MNKFNILIQNNYMNNYKINNNIIIINLYLNNYNINNIRNSINKIIKNNYNKSIKYIEIYCNGILLGTLFITNYYLSKLNIKKKSIFLNNNNSFFFENNYIEILF